VKKALLVVPPYLTTCGLYARLYPMPMALVSIGSALQRDGWHVEIKDFVREPRKVSAQSPTCFAHRGAPAYWRFGASHDEVLDWIGENVGNFDAVGLAGGQCNLFEGAAEVAGAIRSAGKPLVCGGAFVTADTADAMKRIPADVYVTGEGEAVANEAFTRAADGERGITVEGGHVEMDQIPMPDWTLAPPSTYPKADGRVRGVLFVSRGCPHACEFCSVSAIVGRKYRRHPFERIRDEMRALYIQGVRYFTFLDDNLFLTESYVDEICGIIEEFRSADTGWNRCLFYAEEGLEVRMAAKPGVVKRLKDAGFINITIGLETMNPTVREKIRKPYSDEMLAQAVANIQAADLKARAFYIVGFPGDTLQSTARDLVRFARLGLGARANNLNMLPGTETTRQFREAGWIDQDYDWRLSAWWTPPSGTMSYAQIKKAKGYLSAFGKMSDELDVDLFQDTDEQVVAKMARKRFAFEWNSEARTVRIKGNMYRAGTLMHLAELYLIIKGAKGARARMADENTIEATSAETPKDEAQAAIAAAVNGEEVATPVLVRRDPPPMPALPEGQDRVLRVTCSGTELLLPFEGLTDFQRDLKVRTDEETSKIIQSIIRYGFSFPFFVWQSEGTNYCFDGHGRMSALARMRDDGWEIPPLPVVLVHAKDEEEAKQKLLRLNSQYGHMTKYSLREFIADMKVDWSELSLPGGDTLVINEVKVGEGEEKLDGPFSKEEVVEACVAHWLKEGFPYPKFPVFLAKFEVNRLAAKTADAQRGSLFGLQVANSYHPHRWGLRAEGAQLTVLEGWSREAVLRKEMSLEYDAQMLSDHYNTVMGCYHGVQECANFRPGVASWVYRTYGRKDSIVVDPCMGFGGRIIGYLASKLGGSYHGWDPERLTYEGNVRMVTDFGVQEKFNLTCGAFEDSNVEALRDKATLVFTRPPYFSKEKYGEGPGQSFIRYPAYADWVEGFMRPLVERAWAWLMPGCYFVLNIANVLIKSEVVPVADDASRIARDHGFNLEVVQTFHFGARQGASGQKKRGNTVQSGEPVYVFKKPGSWPGESNQEEV
jgi:radical SAM superfamily enzyme YgiQ (UPF0313 family)